MLRNLQSKIFYLIFISFIMIFLSYTALFAGDETLSWDAPTTNTDGTSLTDLAGYIIYYGTATGDYSQNIDVSNVTTYQVPNLTNGLMYYFSVTAYDTFMNESDYSNEISRTVGTTNNSPTSHPGGPYSGIEGQAITLNGSGSSDSDGTIGMYVWDIDNNGTYEYSSSLPTQNHTYAQQGAYTIKLRVTDNLGAANEATTTTNIADTSPTASFTASATIGIAPLTVQFTNNAAGYDQPFTYAWDFENNGSFDSTAPNPSYIYINAGTYSVKLTVADSDGSPNSLTRTNYITVTPSTPSLYTLSVTKSGVGSGTVTSNPVGIACGVDCTEDYTVNTVVSLTAAPDGSSTFGGWSGDADCSDGQLTMIAARTCTASFVLNNETSLSAPTITETVGVSNSKIKITWTDINKGKSNFEIERSLSQTGGFKKIKTSGRNEKMHTDSGLAADTSYFYRVRTIKSSKKKGNKFSPYSNIASESTL